MSKGRQIYQARYATHHRIGAFGLKKRCVAAVVKNYEDAGEKTRGKYRKR